MNEKLAPEEFSLDDVRHLQKLIRELHAENIQKTLSYIQLEQAYYCLKGTIIILLITFLVFYISLYTIIDEVTDLKRLKVKQKENSEGRARASSNMKFDEGGKEELLKASLHLMDQTDLIG